MLSKIKETFGTSLATTQFYTYGRYHFTKSGYDRHVKDYYNTPVQTRANVPLGKKGYTTKTNDNKCDDNFCYNDGVDLSDKTIVITGANSGIGKELATYAAAKNATVYLLCRSQQRAQNARREIIESITPSSKEIPVNKKVHILLADMAELDQIKMAVEELQSKESTIDCLVCNAGALLHKKELTQDGKREVVLSSHLLGGSYYLTKLLHSQLQNSSRKGNQPRVIYVTSGGMYTTKFPNSWEEANNQSLSKPESYSGLATYSWAKRGQVMLAERFSKLNDGVTYVSAHPGWVDTKGVLEAFGDSGKSFLKPLRNTWEGSEGIAWLMGTPARDICNGGLYLDRRLQPKHISGPFMSEGSFTKNTQSEMNVFMKNLQLACGI